MSRHHFLMQDFIKAVWKKKETPSRKKILFVVFHHDFLRGQFLIKFPLRGRVILRNYDDSRVLGGRRREQCNLDTPTLGPRAYYFLAFLKEVRALDDTLNLRDTFCADIRYADDTTLISAIFDKLKISTEQLNTACKKWGMKINGAKCNIISPSPEEITIDGAQREHVGQFTFLGSVVPPCSEDVNRRISLAAAAFGRLRTAVWNRREIGMAGP